jgi:hypothetical protein
MSNLSPTHVLTALASVEYEWPALVGANWPNIEGQYRDLCARLESATGPAQMLAAVDLIQLFAPYAAARERLSTALAGQTETGSILVRLAELADRLGLDPAVGAQFKVAAQPESSQRIIWQSSPTKATSLKLENIKLSLDLGESFEFIFGLITTVTKDVIGEANLILQAGGVLLMLASFYKAVRIHLDECEATVFCGFARAPVKKSGGVKEKVILEYTNAVRAEVSLKPLDRQELANALYKLAEIKSVERVVGQAETWKIVEKHHLKTAKKQE